MLSADNNNVAGKSETTEGRIMKQGTQIIYVPYHAMGDTNHPDCWVGFIISNAPLGRTVIVHYWQPGAVGVTLRTGPHWPVHGFRSASGS